MLAQLAPRGAEFLSKISDNSKMAPGSTSILQIAQLAGVSGAYC